jgi:hypothetical protein
MIQQDEESTLLRNQGMIEALVDAAAGRIREGKENLEPVHSTSWPVS